MDDGLRPARGIIFGLVVAGAFWLGVLVATFTHTRWPMAVCFEDQVLAVQHDPDPSHGLTWACEGIEEFIERGGR